MSMVVTLGIRDFTRSAKEEDFPSMYFYYDYYVVVLVCWQTLISLLRDHADCWSLRFLLFGGDFTYKGFLFSLFFGSPPCSRMVFALLTDTGLTTGVACT